MLSPVFWGEEADRMSAGVVIRMITLLVGKNNQWPLLVSTPMTPSEPLSLLQKRP